MGGQIGERDWEERKKGRETVIWLGMLINNNSEKKYFQYKTEYNKSWGIPL